MHWTLLVIITPLINILPFHWLTCRARHMICRSFTRRRPCDSASFAVCKCNVCCVIVRRLSHGVQYTYGFLPTSTQSDVLMCVSETRVRNFTCTIMIIVCWGVTKQILTALTRAMVKTTTRPVIPGPFHPGCALGKQNVPGITSGVIVNHGTRSS